MKKMIALASVLAMGALGMACGDAPANNGAKPASPASATKPAAPAPPAAASPAAPSSPAAASPAKAPEASPAKK